MSFCQKCENQTDLVALLYLDGAEYQYCYECVFKEVGFSDELARKMSLIYELKNKRQQE